DSLPDFARPVLIVTWATLTLSDSGQPPPSEPYTFSPSFDIITLKPGLPREEPSVRTTVATAKGSLLPTRLFRILANSVCFNRGTVGVSHLICLASSQGRNPKVLEGSDSSRSGVISAIILAAGSSSRM